MTRNDEIRRLLDTLLATRADAVDPSMRDRAREDAAMTLAYDCGELLGSIVPALLAENEEQARRIERLERVLAAERMESAAGWIVGGRTQWICEAAEYPFSAQVVRSEHKIQWAWWVEERTSDGYLVRPHSGFCQSAIEAMQDAEAALRGDS